MLTPDTINPRPTQTARGWTVGIVLLLLLLLPILYVLGLGPAVYLHNRDRLSLEVYMGIYGPLVWLAKRSDTVDFWLTSYVRWYEEWVES